MGGPFWHKYATPHFCAEKGVVFMYIFIYNVEKQSFFMQKLEENSPLMAQKWGVAYLCQN